MKKIERHPLVLHLPPPHMWQLTPSTTTLPPPPSSPPPSSSANSSMPYTSTKSGSISRIHVHQQWIQHVAEMAKYNPHEYINMRNSDNNSDLESDDEDSELRKSFVLNIIFI